MTSRPPRSDASMTLLREVFERPIDPGYAEVGRRQAAGEEPRPPWWRDVLVLVLAVALGMASVWAARELRTPGPDADAARELLISKITDESRRAEARQARNSDLGTQIEQLQSESLAGVDGDVLEQIREVAVSAGSVAVRGPGVVITLDDSRDALEGAPAAELGYVQDLDLQVLVNSLWSSGAEAVGINDHRLTGLSSIRSAGRAIFVDVTPLNRPYQVVAIGDPQDLQARLAQSTGGSHLATLSDVFGISVTLDGEEDLMLPGSTTRTLRYAEPLATPEVSAGRS